MKIYNSIEIVELKTAEEFISFLRPTNPYWGNDTDLEWIFRGQPNYKWELIPRAWRDQGIKVLTPLMNKIEEYLDTDEGKEMLNSSIDINNITETSRYKQLIIQICAELEATKQFLSFSDELGFNIGNKEEIPDSDSYINHLGLKKVLPTIVPKKGFGFAQHHGIPTRFLDWTRRPLIAAYFASAVPKKEIPEKIAVWAINIEFIRNKRLNHNIKRLLCSQHDNQFLHKQDGLFLYYDKATVHYLKVGKYPAFEEIIEEEFNKNGLDKRPLIKVTLPFSEVENLKNLLWKERISLAHLMPTHDNFAKELTELWRNLKHLRINVTGYGEDFDD